MENPIIITILRTIVVYALAIFLARNIGRKLISHMTFFDFVVGVSMGSLSANAMANSGDRGTFYLTGLITLSILNIGIDYINIKSFKMRKLIDSEPVTLVENGTIVEENMKNTKMTVGELMMKMREKNAFSLTDVEFAIMETDGELSVLPKADKKPLTPSQMKIKTKSEGLMKDIIIDGKLIEENMKSAGVDSKWVNVQLKQRNVSSISEVFYAGVYADKKLHVSKKSQNKYERHH